MINIEDFDDMYSMKRFQSIDSDGDENIGHDESNCCEILDSV